MAGVLDLCRKFPIDSRLREAEHAALHPGHGVYLALDAMDTPAYPSNIGKTRYLKSIDGVRISFIVEDEIVLPQGDGSKLVYLQKFRGIHEDTVEYRFTYYMLGVKPRRKGKWVFGQYSLIIPAHELPTLLTEARKRGWDGF